MQQRTAVAVVFASMTLVTLMLLAGHGPWAGRPILSFFGGHGLNTGDIVPLAAWAVSAVSCAVLWRRSR
jgi:hypothetical protein